MQRYLLELPRRLKHSVLKKNKKRRLPDLLSRPKKKDSPSWLR